MGSTCRKTQFSSFAKRYARLRGQQARASTVKQLGALVKAHMGYAEGLSAQEAFLPAAVRRWRSGIVKDKAIDPRYKNRLISCFRTMEEQAWKWGLVKSADHRKNALALDGVRERLEPKKERQAYSAAQLEAFVENAAPEDRLMFRLFIWLGARISEFCGLTVASYDASGRSIRIDRQVVYAGDGSWRLTKELKTKDSYRDCPLPDDIADELEAHISKLGLSGNRFLFSLKRGNKAPYGKSSFIARMKAAMAKAGLPKGSAHSFRHSKATMLAEACQNMADAVAAAKFLGHSVAMFLDTYSHADEARMRTVLGRLQSI